MKPYSFLKYSLELQINSWKLFKQTEIVVNCFTEFQTGKSKVILSCKGSVEDPKSIDSQAVSDREKEGERVEV